MNFEIIDDYQESEKIITMLYIIESEKLDFIALSVHLLIEISRAVDDLIIITNFTRIETDENKRKRYIYDLLKHKISIKSEFATYQNELPNLNLIIYNSNVF